jgi:sn-glycerol 3-phosphate transport system substrate-binding protein
VLNGNKPDFDGKASLETLKILFDMNRNGSMTVRSINELNYAFVDFLRTKAMMIIGPSTGYQLSTRYSFAFKMGTVPLPGKTIAGEAQFVIFKTDNPEVRKGAFEFWQYITRPDNVARFTKDSAYLPIRKSAIKLLGDSPLINVIKDSLASFEKAENIPPLVEFLDWRRALEDQLERSLKGGVEPKVALSEAQKQALK